MHIDIKPSITFVSKKTHEKDSHLVPFCHFFQKRILALMGAWAPGVSVAMPVLNSVELGELCLVTAN